MTWSTRGYADIASLLTGRSGLSFPPARHAFAEAGIARAMMGAHTKDPLAYLELVSNDPRHFDTLLSEITVGETYFYRDPKQLEFIKEAVFPNLGQSARIWSAGCSSGEEAYTLAIALEQCGLESRSQVFGSDISRAAIETAREGVYGDWSFREIDSMWRARYFTRNAKRRWKIAPRFSARVRFEVGNLAETRTADGFDLILCRNVLMYLESDVVARVTSLLISSLREGGWLFTSPSDPIISVADIEIVTTSCGLAYRRVASRAFSVELAAASLEGRSHFLSIENAHSNSGHSSPPGSVPIRTPSRETSSRPAAPSAANASQTTATVIGMIDETLDAQRYVREAMELLDDDRAGEAAIAARRAIFLDRTGAFAHLLLGRALRLGGRAVAARRALGRARQLSEDGDGIAASVEAELSLLRARSSTIGLGV
ncbi:MAG TPA: protein-glutamate O-methyltransferase CheR [Candidatus Acidoferrales bacterium]|nr:protein-glutamate O-methyltransferase CheR [Candidatus Acidoferrales bacterium]